MVASARVVVFGTAAVSGLADADDGVFVAQEFRRGSVGVFSGQGHFLKLPIGFFFVASAVLFKAPQGETHYCRSLFPCPQVT